MKQLIKKPLFWVAAGAAVLLLVGVILLPFVFEVPSMGLTLGRISQADGSYIAVAEGLGTCTDTRVVIPATYEGASVNEVTVRAFQKCDGIESVSLPRCMRTVGEDAFSYCSALREAKLGGTQTLGDGAFEACTSLRRVEGKKLSLIGAEAFRDCTSLEAVALGDGLETVGRSAFEGCAALKKITLPRSVKRIEGDAFWGTGLTDLYFEGTEAEWNAVYKGGRILPEGVTVHFGA